MTEAEFKKNLKSRLWRLQNLYYVKNEQGKKVKFKLRPAQLLFLQFMHFRNLILKSRQHGFTTLLCIYALDMIIFNSNVRCGFVAHESDAAEEIFFDKILFAFENLPSFIKNIRQKVKRAAKMLVVSHGDGDYSGIKVGTSLRGGTYQFLHISELGKICAKYPKKAKEINLGTLPAVPATGQVVIESTAEGPHGLFYDMSQEAMTSTAAGVNLSDMDFKFHFFGWTQNPANYLDPAGVAISTELHQYFNKLENEECLYLTDGQKAFYAKSEKQFGEDVLQEYPTTPAEAFKKRVAGAYYAVQMSKARSSGRVGSCSYEPALPVFTFWDLGISDSMSIWFTQFTGQEVRIIDYYENNNESLQHYVKHLQNAGYVYGGHFGPHDLNVREQSSGLTRKAILKKMGIDMTALPAVDVISSIDTVRGLLDRCWFDLANCERGINCLESYRKAYNEKMERYESHPLHDWASHGADSFRYLAIAYSLGKISTVTAVNQEVIVSNNYPSTGEYDPIAGKVVR